MIILEKFKDKIGSKYTPKRTNLHHYKKICPGGMPPNRLSKAHGFTMRRNVASRHANFQI